MKTTKTLLDEIGESTSRTIMLFEQEIANLDADMLKRRPNSKSWSVAQCLQHMNLAHENYLLQMEAVLSGRSPEPPVKHHKQGVMGKLTTRMMRPDKKHRIRWKMKTMPKMEPVASNMDTGAILREFERQQRQILAFARKAEYINLSKARIKTALGPLKFNFVDALAFIVAHTERHMQQAINTKNTIHTVT